jgi:carboxymethylenebutenolidase
LVSGEVTVDVNGFKMPAYRSAPEGAGPWPVVLVISEIFGVHEYIADVTRRLARMGYLAIAPELFVRQGDPSAYGEMAKLQSEVIA